MIERQKAEGRGKREESTEPLAPLPRGWTNTRFENLLDYVQPTNFIVESTEYDDSFATPVLTAGKSFIIGYTHETNGIYNEVPVIIFDDFTTSTQFVNFPFKVKSSAMKILKPTSKSIIIKFIFYFMQTIRINADTHKRYWISYYSQLPIPLPPLSEQRRILAKIEELFSDLDKGIENLKTAQQQLKVYRQAVLKWAFEGKLTNESVVDGELPEGWQLTELGKMLSQSPQNGLYKPSADYGSGTRIVRIDGFYEGKLLPDYEYKRVRLTQDELERYRVSAGDILVNRVNSLSHLGKCGFVERIQEETVFESNIMKIVINKSMADAKYVSVYLSSIRGLTELRQNAKHAVN